MVTRSDPDRQDPFRVFEDRGCLGDLSSLAGEHCAKVIRLAVNPLIGEGSLLTSVQRHIPISLKCQQAECIGIDRILAPEAVRVGAFARGQEIGEELNRHD